MRLIGVRHILFCVRRQPTGSGCVGPSAAGHVLGAPHCAAAGASGRWAPAWGRGWPAPGACVHRCRRASPPASRCLLASAAPFPPPPPRTPGPASGRGGPGPRGSRQAWPPPPELGARGSWGWAGPGGKRSSGLPGSPTHHPPPGRGPFGAQAVESRAPSAPGGGKGRGRDGPRAMWPESRPRRVGVGRGSCSRRPVAAPGLCLRGGRSRSCPPAIGRRASAARAAGNSAAEGGAQPL